MKILLVGINYAPELTGIGKYSGEMCEWLVANGCEVRVISAPPYYPDWKLHAGYSKWSYSSEVIKGVTVLRSPLWVPARPTGLKRILHLATFAISSLPITVFQLFWRPNVVISIEPPFFCTPAALLCAKLSRANSWLHIQDFEIDAAFELGLLQHRWLRRLVNGIESWLMRRFDKVSTISDKMVERVQHEKGVAEDRTALFMNWVDTDAIFPISGPNELCKQLRIPSGKVIALYSGNMGEKQGLEVVLQAAELMHAENEILFVLCGDGAARARLQNQFQQLTNVIWLPLQPLDKLNELLNMADIHLLPQKTGAADLLMPSKLTGMLASGRPVIATAMKNTQIGEVLTGCGVLVEPENPSQLADAIHDLAKDTTKRTKLGISAREYAVTHWSKEHILAEFKEKLLNI